MQRVGQALQAGGVNRFWRLATTVMLLEAAFLLGWIMGGLRPF